MLRGVLVVLLVGLCSGAWPQGDFALEYRAYKDFWETPYVGVSQWLSKNPGLPRDLPGELVGKGARSFTVRAVGGEVLMVTSEDPEAELYVDIDRDGDLSDEKPIARWGVGGRYRWYGPVVVPVIESKGWLAARFNVVTGKTSKDPFMLIARPAGYRTGTVRLRGDRYRIALIDFNLNGRYNDVCTAFGGDYSKLDADCFAIDLNGDGAFSSRAELAPLTEAICVWGTYYSLAVLPDGAKVRLRRVRPQFRLGRLDVGCKEMGLALFSSHTGLLILSGSKGQWDIPAGNYTVMFSAITRVDREGVKWNLPRWFKGRHETGSVIVARYTDDGLIKQLKRGELLREQLASLTIQPGKTLKLGKMGPPLRMVTTVTRQGSGNNLTVLINFALVGQGGEEYERSARRNGASLGPPKLRIFDDKDKLLESGSFLPAWRDAPDYLWEVRGSYRGKFRVEITLNIGPFNPSSKTEWYDVESLPRHKPE